MKIQEINIDALKPYANNPRKNDGKAVEAVAKSITDFGFKVPILVTKDYEIISGHTRLKAAKKLGMTKIPCIVDEDLTEAQIKAFRIADNKVAEEATWDFFALAKELNEIEGLDFSLDTTGFSESETENILELISKDDEENPVVYKPTYEPTQSQRLVSEDEFKEKEQKLSEQFTYKNVRRQNYNTVVCPECGNEFDVEM